MAAIIIMVVITGFARLVFSIDYGASIALGFFGTALWTLFLWLGRK
jgi:hypothetical protein